MSNSIFDALLEEKIESFKADFLNTSRSVFVDPANSKLRHPGEFGTYRERICKNLFRLVVPSSLEIDSGFVISSSGYVSTQCDIVIYDSSSTPIIRSGEHQKFFPIETICAVGEIKSVLSKKSFEEAIAKLTLVKQARVKIPDATCLKRTHPGAYNPDGYPYDQIFTFLICERFDFNFLNMDFNKLYGAIPYQHWYNMILSMKDGVFLWHDANKRTLPYSFLTPGARNRMRFVAPTTDPNVHYKFFLDYLFMGTTSNTILYPDMTSYITWQNGGGQNYDEP